MGWVCLVIFGLVPSGAEATHEADHRFTIYGHVRDQDGTAVQDAKVTVVDTRIGDGSTAFTDRHGYYEVLLHLHNDNLGDEIRVTTQNESKTVIATFDSDDKMTERKVQVDFGAVLPERPSDASRLWLYGGGAALLVAAFLYWGILSRKKARARSQGPRKRRNK